MLCCLTISKNSISENVPRDSIGQISNSDKTSDLRLILSARPGEGIDDYLTTLIWEESNHVMF